MSEPAAELRALRRKYETLAALRATRTAEPDPMLAALAAEFPGALREIDVLPLETLAARIAALAAAELTGVTEPWMTAQVAFHRLARGALVAKRWLAGRKVVDEAVRAAFSAAHLGAEAQVYAADLGRVAAPPGGRVMTLVYEKLGDELGVSPEDARALVEPTRPTG